MDGGWVPGHQAKSVKGLGACEDAKRRGTSRGRGGRGRGSKEMLLILVLQGYGSRDRERILLMFHGHDSDALMIKREMNSRGTPTTWAAVIPPLFRDLGVA
jgi:hypothetical protein